MIFGEFTLEQAHGVMLAHTLRVGDRTLKKGRRIDAADVAAMRAVGIARVTGVRLGVDDLDEDTAAAEVAALLGGAGVAPRKPYTGRCNLHAQAQGVVQVDAAAIDRVNRVDEAITVGTSPPFVLARATQVVATVKIIPFAVSRRTIDACRAAIGNTEPVRLAPLLPHRAALILTESSTTRDATLDATVAVTRQRLAELGSTLVLERRCAHEGAALGLAVREALDTDCELLLISGATATKDRGDVVPAAIVAAGGRIEHFGMPVEPGNMLLIGRVDRVPVINLPGCARSQRLNGLDWVLRRMLAGLPLGRDEITGMGVGGLIRSPLTEDADDVPARPVPPRAARIAALVLAAGRSTRMAPNNKLLLPVDGVPMVLRVVDAALASHCNAVTVVVGHQAQDIMAIAAARDVTFAYNSDYAAGLSTSLRRGLRSLPRDVDGVVVLLGDMPHVTAAHVDRLIDVFDPVRQPIVIPRHAGRRGNPILWPMRMFPAMDQMRGDAGARALLERHARQIVTVEMDSDAIFLDIDTLDSLT